MRQKKISGDEHYSLLHRLWQVEHLKKGASLGQAPALPANIRLGLKLERLARDKHSRLLRKSVNYSRKKFYRTGPYQLEKLLPNFKTEMLKNLKAFFFKLLNAGAATFDRKPFGRRTIGRHQLDLSTSWLVDQSIIVVPTEQHAFKNVNNCLHLLLLGDIWGQCYKTIPR